MKYLILLSYIFLSGCATLGNNLPNNEFYSGVTKDGNINITVVKDVPQYYYIDKTNGEIFVNQHEIIELNAPADRTLLPLNK